MSDATLADLLARLGRAEGPLAAALRQTGGPAADAAALPAEPESGPLAGLFSGDPAAIDCGDRFLADLLAQQGEVPQDDEPAAIETLVQLYAKLPAAGLARGEILRRLAERAAYSAYLPLLIQDPPREPRAADRALVSLFRRPEQAASLFPRLLEGIAHPQIAVGVLDLANHLYRSGAAPRHPAAGHGEQLVRVLGGAVEGLRLQLERGVPEGGELRQCHEQVGLGIALVAAVCDALGLIGDPAAVPKLTQALSLPHRRIRAEAAAALARLGEPSGRETLALLAADPVSRSRALAYLEEVELLDQAAAEHQTPQARAIGEAYRYLAETSQFGLPPTRVDLIDHARLYWPGYSEPVDCWLLTYEYDLPQFQHEGVLLVGPVTHTVLADVQDLPPADIYALFAGWHVEHPEIGFLPAERMPSDDRAALQASLAARHGTDRDVVLAGEGRFLGTTVLLATARRDGRPGILVCEGAAAEFFPLPAVRRPLGPAEVFYLYLGRRLLAQFNP